MAPKVKGAVVEAVGTEAEDEPGMLGCPKPPRPVEPNVPNGFSLSFSLVSVGAEI